MSKSSDNTHSARVVLAKIQTLTEKLTQKIAFEEREEIYKKISELTDRLREINERNSR